MWFVSLWLNFQTLTLCRTWCELCTAKGNQNVAETRWLHGYVHSVLHVLTVLARRYTVNRFTQLLLFTPAISTFSQQEKQNKQTRFTQSAKSTPTFPGPTPNGDKLCMFAREKETQSIIQNQYSLWVCAQGGGKRRAAALPRWSKALHASPRLVSVFRRTADQRRLLKFWLTQ